MPDEAKDDIIGVDRLNPDQVLVEFSNDTVAVYSKDDLTALPNERMRADLTIPEKVD
jgi:hypothetical protein